MTVELVKEKLIKAYRQRYQESREKTVERMIKQLTIEDCLLLAESKGWPGDVEAERDYLKQQLHELRELYYTEIHDDTLPDKPAQTQTGPDA